ncbi:hypothetical protein H7849_14230 [Alloacidobacterium dinghuense]|uniref:Uncharacterized protein n=1 Tax=Alloacidobacterium dinghuense TaxID=2763107 RepID=A0A7G8BCQ9_9BACT|nr:hypothetical protein [Alloacidobacterium dinghuense]QNI30329.1 hypothetical protein H7849_14230 [Alloacidobacterium dinghuense]
MKTFAHFSLTFSLLVIPVTSAVAGVTISSPGNGNQVSSPFNLSAYASSCSSQNVVAMGYSLDGSIDTTILNGTSVQTQVSSGTGSHTLHVKAWGQNGASCVTDVALTVTAASNAPYIPSNAVSVSSIQTLSNWQAVYDVGTSGGYSTGSMNLVGTPSRSGNARQFTTWFSNYGGVRYHTTFGDDNESTNFLYDVWVYLNDSAPSIGNLEMDLNQVMPNGQTVIFGFQCDGYTSTWDYTVNGGSAWNPSDQWAHSGAYCNPRGWSRNAWHHVQISYSRDNSGNVNYKSVWLDGLQEPINATAYSAFSLGWAPTLLTNFQVDGLGSGGTPIVLIDDLTVYRW